ncbi:MULTISPECIES: TetR/AcrR family transcriptional regulator [unclassified Streptomyces]|uniref:TetR/AcrR family transcriptional regulator n=1 Tax=Streptomyces TaxID=1883 RepID=UPI0001C1BF35|nr:MULTISPECIES: TetR/AcrR family transcriptional regulator [unclassified Streptomyces]AEN11475.1 transcriptional regulator, TetR family [Streptomyces sp. SirexAA-E]MYR67501.1 TetR family transcriptional regulator [Streptomyces sp. SID4939]MYS04251.1 TetR family transcriptional regulator [Streptomyces sp. SID4940]MYT62000.1 TetR family transcriptional regulator [Streptomyces sp. SID8357]MYT85370.1 TetR family transcriptional regulator [Streptomyces sp. SID8360]
MAEAPAASRRRKLTPEREHELLRVTAELVGEVGYEQVTMAAVAQRAKCSTATLYRQWESKPRLVISAWKALTSEAGKDLSRIDTGSLRGDLMDVARYLVSDDPVKDTFTTVPAAIVQDEGLMEIVREILIHPILRDLAQLFERAVDRGEIEAANPVIGLADQILLGPWLAQNILHGIPATQELMETVVERVLLPALTAQSATA